MYVRYGKRVLDILLAAAALFLFAPLMLITALAIRVCDGAPILFRQKRVGQNEHLFEIRKFRSLPLNTGDVPSAQAATLKPTKIGKLIRRTNIDELPQLINILHGEMSAVGPRPALSSQKQLLAARRANGAMTCCPGLTGLAQINSYDNMPEAEKARRDGEYAAHITFARDCKIILRTLRYLTKPPPIY